MSASTVDEVKRSFRRAFGTTLALDFVAKAVSAVTVVVLIRGLSVSTYAYLTMFLTFALFLGSSATGGVRTGYLRQEAERVSRQEGGGRDERLFIDALLKSIGLICVVGLVSIPIALLVGVLPPVEVPLLLLCAVLFASGSAALELSLARKQAQRRFLAAGVLNVARTGCLLGAAIVVMLTHNTRIGMSAWFAATMVGIGILAVWPWADIASNWGGRRRVTAAFSREEVWLTVFYAAAAGFAYVDLVVARAMLTDVAVATLGASLRYLAILLGAMPALGAVLRVRTAQVDLIDSPPEQRTMLLGWLRRSLLPTTAFILLALVAVPFFVPILDGGKYPASTLVLQIFLLTVLAAYVTAPATSLLLTQKSYRTLALVYTAGLGVNLIGDVALAGRYGVTGIAVASTTVYVLLDLVVVVAALTRTSTKKD